MIVTIITTANILNHYGDTNVSTTSVSLLSFCNVSPALLMHVRLPIISIYLTFPSAKVGGTLSRF